MAPVSTRAQVSIPQQATARPPSFGSLAPPMQGLGALPGGPAPGLRPRDSHTGPSSSFGDMQKKVSDVPTHVFWGQQRPHLPTQPHVFITAELITES